MEDERQAVLVFECVHDNVKVNDDDLDGVIDVEKDEEAIVEVVRENDTEAELEKLRAYDCVQLRVVVCVDESKVV